MRTVFTSLSQTPVNHTVPPRLVVSTVTMVGHENSEHLTFNVIRNYYDISLHLHLDTSHNAFTML